MSDANETSENQQVATDTEIASHQQEEPRAAASPRGKRTGISIRTALRAGYVSSNGGKNP